jgi:uncharacterized protein YbjQ (UPF0145 family)
MECGEILQLIKGIAGGGLHGMFRSCRQQAFERMNGRAVSVTV